LCEEYGLTHTPLREALRLLAAHGFVDYEAQRGYRVAEVTIEELKELYEAREALEGMAARKLAERATQAQKKELMSLAAECDELASLAQDGPQTTERDIRFHRLIAELSGNGVISQLLASPIILVRGLVKPFEMSSARLDVSSITHTAVARAIVSGDPEEAESVIRDHIRQACQQRLSSLQGSADCSAAGDGDGFSGGGTVPQCREREVE
jgi:DNA-binding GntR family transcriptional regulator